MPLTQRQIYRRRRTVVFGGAGIVLAAGFYLPLTLLAPLPQVAPTVASYSAPAPVSAVIDFPAYGASGLGAIGYPGVLAQGGATAPLPIASISKVVTALVVLDAKPLGPTELGPEVVFSAVDVGFYDEQVAQDGIVAPVQVGLVMSQRHIMDLALMASANNYAQSLAAWAFGSEAGYVEAARVWLAEVGMTSTTIADATGINPANTSTVADLVTLAKLAIADPVVSQIVATPALEIPQIGVVENRNALLGLDGIDGIKTGTLDEAGSCLLFSADHTIGSETVTLVGVVLGGPSHDTINAAVRELLAQADAGFTEVTLTTEGEPFADYRTAWGDEAAAVAASTTSIVIWGDAPITAQIKAEPVTLASAGAPAGRVSFRVGEREVSVALLLSSSIDDPGPWWRLGNPTRLF